MNKSRFDPSRPTVGAIYRNAQIEGEKKIITGDMNYEMKKDLVEDINIAANQGRETLGNKPFYLAFYEKRDLQMPRCIIRIPKIWRKRPYPEQDSIVFRVYPDDIYFCWELPHRSEMLNELGCPGLYEPERLDKYRHWENLRLEHFGFMKDEEGSWKENPNWRGDIKITQHQDRTTTVSLATLV